MKPTLHASAPRSLPGMPAALVVLLLLGAASLSSCATDYEESLFGGESGLCIRVLLIGVGLLYLLAGWKIHEFIIQLTGFIFGGIFGAFIAPVIMEDSSALWSILGFILGGVAGAAIALFLSACGVFVVGAILGAVAGAAMFYNSLDDGSGVIAILIAAVIGGVLLLAFYKAWIVGVTSIIGAVLVGVSTGAPGWVWFLLFGVGLVVQYSLIGVTRASTGSGTAAPPPS